MILSFLDTNFSLENQESTPSCLLCDGEDGSDSAGRGGASIPNCLHHPTNDLLTQGSSILYFFKMIPEVLFASKTGTDIEEGK